MTHYPGFTPSGRTFSEYDDPPDEISSAIGRVVLSFSELEDDVSSMIRGLLDIDFERGQIVTAELPFKTKVNLMSSLQKIQFREDFKDHDMSQAEEMLKEIVASCLKAEELRNQIVHSSYRGVFRRGRATRQKTTAKASAGLRIQKVPVDSGYLLDVSEFILDVMGYFDDFEQYLFRIESGFNDCNPEDAPIRLL
jgi:hypothetical protein